MIGIPLAEMINLNKILEIFVGSGTALALGGGIYYWIVKGRIKIPKKFDFPHEDSETSRHKIRVINYGFKSLLDLTPYITFINLEKDDLENVSFQDYLISPENYVPIEQEMLIWDIETTSINFHPNREVDVYLLKFEKDSKHIIIPSEQGFTNEGKKARAKIKNLKEYIFYLEFFAENYSSNKFFFRMYPKDDKSDVIIESYDINRIKLIFEKGKKIPKRINEILCWCVFQK